MKKIVLILCAAIGLLFISSTSVPSSVGYINDYGHLLSEAKRNSLEQMLKTYHDSTSNELAVLTLEKFDDRTEGVLFDYSLKVFRTWGIGEKSKNNGVLLVVVKNLASKNAPGLRIATGSGLEGALTDFTCRTIIDTIRPMINAAKYDQGIETGLTLIIKSIKGEFKADCTGGLEAIPWWGWVIIIIILLIVMIVIGSGGYTGLSSYSSDSSSGGGFGGFSGGSSSGGGAGD